MASRDRKLTVHSAFLLQKTYLSLQAEPIFVLVDPSGTVSCADLIITAYETDDHGVFLSALHTVHCANLKLWAILGTQHGTKERDLGLISMKVRSGLDQFG